MFCAPTDNQTTVLFFQVVIFSSFVIIGVCILTQQMVIWDLFQPSARRLYLFPVVIFSSCIMNRPKYIAGQMTVPFFLVFNLRKFLLGFFILQKQWDPNFLLLCISFFLCVDLQPYSHDCFSKILKTLFDFWNNTYWVSLFERNNLLIFRTGVPCFSVILFYSTLLALTHRQKDWQRVKYTHYAWAGGTFFSVVLLCQFFVLGGNRFWFYILLMYL